VPLYIFTDSKLTAAESGNLVQAPPVVPLKGAQVNSGFICQMNEEKLLIPERNIHLQDCVGQG